MDREKRQFYRMVIGLVLPMALQNLINVGVTSADVIMLGKVGETALSASSLGGQVYFILNLIFFGLTSGAAVLTAQYWGKQDTKTIERVLGISLRISLAVGFVFTLAAELIPSWLMRIFTNEEEIIQAGVPYLRIVAVSYLFTAVTMVYLNIMRSVEKVIIATVVYSVSLLVNVVLNAIFIFGLLGFPAMGVAGAALATAIARFVELVIVLWHNSRNKVVKLRLKYVGYREKLLMKDFGRYVLPVLFNELLWGGGMATISAILGHLGSAAVAANSVVQVTRQLAMVVSFGVAGATAIVLGKTIGEGKEELARTYARRFARMSVVLGIAGGLVVLGVSPIARHFLNLTPQASHYLKYMMYIMSYFCVGQSINTVLIVGVFRSGGDTRFGLVLDGITLWGGAILLGMIAAFVWKLSVPLVFVFLASDEILKLPFSFWRYRSLKWLKNITREQTS
ncbi:MAG TPA: MATE family efflux transporter [Candidatus Egerieimonas intestinavium]|uniref:MATE family efflux transporter n=1 Tax=Candidatus Egerieimonas intestinavium TaxID=2840777 RepID=A0A9D1JEU3_9FIRM|nr:MATE family efflux transporter [Candidatus Egerieimonas intestinavium]